MKMFSSQELPASGPNREALRVKGQFWTPDWVAEAMVGYVLAGGSLEIFDPAVGAGAFLYAAKILAAQSDRKLTLLGTELDREALAQARQIGLDSEDLAQVQIRDFVLHPPPRLYEAIVANPPYIRHHRLQPETKALLKAFVIELAGIALDGRAGLHVYFLLRALQHLTIGGRLAFLVPSDICEGVFAAPLWKWITARFQVEAVITFEPSASPFPKIDTNPIIILIRHIPPTEDFNWVKCSLGQIEDLKTWLISGCSKNATNNLILHCRNITKGLKMGLSRPPQENSETKYRLADFAKVMRGIATGSNDFFFLTQTEATSLKIPDEFLITAVGRTRDVSGDEITNVTLSELQAKNRPTRLLALDNRPIEDFPIPVSTYLKQGEKLGINHGELIKQRNPWYKMETRRVPPLLFAYLGRRNVRFIYNRVGVMPLTGFLCVYPHKEDAESIDKLWRILNHPLTIANLALVGKSYGDGAIKVEPRALERLPLPTALVEEMGLQPTIPNPLGTRKLDIANREEIEQLSLWIKVL